MAQNSGVLLAIFGVLLLLSGAALVTAWALGRRWGDLSSRRHYGEALTGEEQAALRRSRRGFWIWTAASLLLAAIAFLVVE